MASKHVWMQSRVVLGSMVMLILVGCAGYYQPVPTVEPVTSVPSLATAQPVTTVLIVRHAERADDTLTPAGQARAEKLAHVVGEAGVTAIYATEFVRTQQTVEPLAAHLDLPVNLYTARDVEELVDQVLSDHAGEVVFIAGHGGTVEAIVKELGGDPIDTLAASEYDNLFIVTIYRPGKASVIHLNYGDAD